MKFNSLIKSYILENWKKENKKILEEGLIVSHSACHTQTPTSRGRNSKGKKKTLTNDSNNHII